MIRASACDSVALTSEGMPLRKALGSFVTGVTVLTTVNSAGVMHGITVSAFTSLSLTHRRFSLRELRNALLRRNQGK